MNRIAIAVLAAALAAPAFAATTDTENGQNAQATERQSTVHNTGAQQAYFQKMLEQQNDQPGGVGG